MIELILEMQKQMTCKLKSSAIHSYTCTVLEGWGEKIIGRSTTQSRTWKSAWWWDWVGCWSFDWCPGSISYYFIVSKARCPLHTGAYRPSRADILVQWVIIFSWSSTRKSLLDWGV